MARRKRQRYLIASNNGYLEGSFASKAAAIKALAEEVRISAASCRRGRRSGCSVVGSARSGHVEIKIGGRQGYNMWQRYAIVKDE